MKVGQAWRSSCGVGVVKPTEDGSRDNTPRRLAADRPGYRRVSKGLMTAALVVVADELGEDRAEVSFAEDDQVVEELTAKCAVHPFDETVLPGCVP